MLKLFENEILEDVGAATQLKASPYLASKRLGADKGKPNDQQLADEVFNID